MRSLCWKLAAPPGVLKYYLVFWITREEPHWDGLDWQLPARYTVLLLTQSRFIVIECISAHPLTQILINILSLARERVEWQSGCEGL